MTTHFVYGTKIPLVVQCRFLIDISRYLWCDTKIYFITLIISS